MSFLWPWLKKKRVPHSCCMKMLSLTWSHYERGICLGKAMSGFRNFSDSGSTIQVYTNCWHGMDFEACQKWWRKKNLAFWKIGLEQLVNQWQSIESGVSCCWERSRHEHVGSGNSDGRIHFLFRKDNPFNIHSIIFNISLLLLQVSSACMQVYTRSSATTWQYQEHRPVFCVKVKETMGFLRPVHTLLLLLVYKNHCLQ